MARGTTLENLELMLRGRIGASLDSNHNKNVSAVHQQILAQEQERLYHDYDWPFLDGHYDVALNAGQRYYDLPVEPESITRVELGYNDGWSELEYGIGAEEYTAYDSDEDERSDPVRKWDYHIDPTDDDLIDNEQFEAWPIPASSSLCTARFWGKRALPRLTQPSDRAILDDLLIVLFAAAVLTKDKGDRETRLSEAQAHYNRLRGRIKKMKKFNMKGRDDGVERKPPGPVRVVLTGN